MCGLTAVSHFFFHNVEAAFSAGEQKYRKSLDILDICLYICHMLDPKDIGWVINSSTSSYD